MSDAKLMKLRPWFYGWKGVLTAISNFIGPPMSGTKASVREQLESGDANAAILLEQNPPLVAAYSEDLDAVALLTFPPDSVDTSELRPGDRLISVNFYQQGQQPEPDLKPGERAAGTWDDFWPLVADFVTDDRERLDQLKSRVPEEHWKRCAALVVDYKARNAGRARDGRPGYGGIRKLYERSPG